MGRSRMVIDAAGILLGTVSEVTGDVIFDGIGLRFPNGKEVGSGEIRDR